MNHSPASLLDIHRALCISYMLRNLTFFQFYDSNSVDGIENTLSLKMTSGIQVGFDLNLV